MSSRSLSPSPSPSVSASGPLEPTPRVRRRPPATALVGSVLMLLQGTLTAVAGCVFSFATGGGWYVGTALFAVALPAWWVAGVGLLRGSRRAHRLGVGLLLAQVAFGLLKVLHYHESAAYVFGAVTLVNLSLVLAGPTRRWAAR
jgi:hypothetical protein